MKEQFSRKHGTTEFHFTICALCGMAWGFFYIDIVAWANILTGIVASYTISRSLFKKSRAPNLETAWLSTEVWIVLVGALGLVLADKMQGMEHEDAAYRIAVMVCVFLLSRGYAKKLKDTPAIIQR